MKKILMIAVISLAAASVFAGGAQEAGADGVVVLDPAAVAMDGITGDMESVKLSGTVDFKGIVPELVSGTRRYALDAPGAMMFASYLKEGQKLEVSGYLQDVSAPDRFFGNGGGMMRSVMADYDGEGIVLVETITMDGVTYKMPWADGSSNAWCVTGRQPFNGRQGAAPGRQGRSGGRPQQGGRWQQGPFAN